MYIYIPPCCVLYVPWMYICGSLSNELGSATHAILIYWHYEMMGLRSNLVWICEPIKVTYTVFTPHFERSNQNVLFVLYQPHVAYNGVTDPFCFIFVIESRFSFTLFFFLNDDHQYCRCTLCDVHENVLEEREFLRRTNFIWLQRREWRKIGK